MLRLIRNKSTVWSVCGTPDTSRPSLFVYTVSVRSSRLANMAARRAFHSDYKLKRTTCGNQAQVDWYTALPAKLKYSRYYLIILAILFTGSDTHTHTKYVILQYLNHHVTYCIALLIRLSVLIILLNVAARW